MSHLQEPPEEFSGPCSPEDLLRLVSGGSYRLVRDPVPYNSELRRALRQLVRTDAPSVIRKARIAGGTCPSCLYPLPLRRRLRDRMRLGVHAWYCIACDWRESPSEAGTLEVSRIRDILRIEFDQASQQMVPPRGALQWARYLLRTACEWILGAALLAAGLAFAIGFWTLVIRGVLVVAKAGL